MKRFVGIDVGGTRIKAGLVNALHRIEAEEVLWLTPEDKSEEGLLAKLAEVVTRVVGPHGRSVVVVGVGVAGFISQRQGMVVRSPNFPSFDRFLLKQRLEPLVHQHVVMDNDANCVIAGEYLQGALAGHHDAAGLTLGTGVGGGLILHGGLWRGHSGMAGELGHIMVDPNGPKCGCGNHGCLEMYPSKVGLREMCRQKPVDGVDTEAEDLPHKLAQAAEAGDATAKAHFRLAGQMLGRGVAMLVNALDLQTVLLAGGLAPTWPLMEESCHRELRKRGVSEMAAGVSFVLATLGQKAGILGAALQWMLQPHE